MMSRGSSPFIHHPLVNLHHIYESYFYYLRILFFLFCHLVRGEINCNHGEKSVCIYITYQLISCPQR